MLHKCQLHQKEEASGFSSWWVCELLLKINFCSDSPSRLCCGRDVLRCSVWGSQGFSYCGHGLSWGTARAVSWTRERAVFPALVGGYLPTGAPGRPCELLLMEVLSQVCGFAVCAMLSVSIRGPASLSGAIIFVAIHIYCMTVLRKHFTSHCVFHH